MNPKTMDKMLSVHQKKTNKQPKSKKKPVKVVYISNPMKVKTSASQFRALVQELTGQDADMPDPARFPDSESVGGGGGGGRQEKVSTEPKAREEGDRHQLQVPQLHPRNEIVPQRSESDHVSCEAFDDDYDEEDDVFTPQMAENFPGLVASNLWYESTHFDELKSLDLM